MPTTRMSSPGSLNLTKVKPHINLSRVGSFEFCISEIFVNRFSFALVRLYNSLQQSFVESFFDKFHLSSWRGGDNELKRL